MRLNGGYGNDGGREILGFSCTAVGISSECRRDGRLQLRMHGMILGVEQVERSRRGRSSRQILCHLSTVTAQQAATGARAVAIAAALLIQAGGV